MPTAPLTISMDVSARYTTQSAAYDKLLIGRTLTDRRIAQLKKQGYYGSGLVLREAVTSKRQRKKEQKTTLDELLKRYNI